MAAITVRFSGFTHPERAAIATALERRLDDAIAGDPGVPWPLIACLVLEAELEPEARDRLVEKIAELYALDAAGAA